MASCFNSGQNLAALWQIWKLFKLIFDLALIYLVDKGFMSGGNAGEIVVLNIITIVFVASSLCEFAAYNHENALIVALVDMGKMKRVVNMSETQNKRQGGTGRDADCDSIYAVGQGADRPDGCVTLDEFLIYDSARIKSFIVCI